jgi:hypothetical protein
MVYPNLISEYDLKIQFPKMLLKLINSLSFELLVYDILNQRYGEHLSMETQIKRAPGLAGEFGKIPNSQAADSTSG